MRLRSGTDPCHGIGTFADFYCDGGEAAHACGFVSVVTAGSACAVQGAERVGDGALQLDGIMAIF